MKVKQFKDGPLAHFSYAIVSDGKMVLIDPERNPKKYYEFAEEENATIVAVFETHPHADFISSHLQIHQETDATIYTSEKMDASYPHKALQHGDNIEIGKVKIICLFTPGHSPDSMSFHVVENDEHYLFTGDCLFIGDVGRPDLREKNDDNSSKAENLAKQMFETIQTKYNDVPDHAIVYPAHGSGSLCGKGMSDANQSTLGNERASNWAFQVKDEKEFVDHITRDQPFIPAYFKFDVEKNLQGVEKLDHFKAKIETRIHTKNNDDLGIIIDVRDEKAFKADSFENSINIMARGEPDKFETWLGAIVKPDEKFTLVVDSVKNIDNILERTAKIGYEENLKKVIVYSSKTKVVENSLDVNRFKNNTSDFTIIDIRNKGEADKIFDHAINIPLPELRNRVSEIPTDKPIVVHCAGGYRSAAGSSIIEKNIKNTQIFDLSDAVKLFQ